MRSLFFCLAILATMVGASVHAEMTDQDMRMVQIIQRTVAQSAIAYKNGDIDQAADGVRLATSQIIAAKERSDAPEMPRVLEPQIELLTRVHAYVQLEGVRLPPLRLISKVPSLNDLSEPAASSDPTPEPSVSPASASPPASASLDAGGVSFVSDVAPILKNRCGGCHIQSTKGGFGLRTYDELMRGPREGVVIFPGDTIGSRLIETIETGDMPRGGGRVPPAELATLKRWINEGAKFDGSDASATLVSLTKPPGSVPVANARPPAKPAKTAAGGAPDFAADIAPILVDRCSGCHVDTGNPRGGFDMNTFASLIDGGDSGAAVRPGMSASSLLIRKLKGEEGNRMPQGGAPLSDDQIQLISTWIDSGASVGPDQRSQPLPALARLAWVSQASPEEVTQRRAELADRNIGLATAGSGAAAEHATGHFRVLGTVDAARLEAVGQAAESLIGEATKLSGSESGEGLFRGKATIFVFDSRYDYGEFAKMAESRSVPRTWDIHWVDGGVDAYIAMAVSDDTAVSGNVDGDRLREQLRPAVLSLAVSTSGDVPRWVAQGLGAAVAFRNVRDRDARTRITNETMTAWSSMKSAKDFLDGKMAPELADRIAASVAGAMLDGRGRRTFDQVMRKVHAGEAFDEAFAATTGVPLETFVTNVAGR